MLALNRCRTAKGPGGLQSLINTPSASGILATSYGSKCNMSRNIRRSWCQLAKDVPCLCWFILWASEAGCCMHTAYWELAKPRNNLGNCYLAWAKCQVPLSSFNALGIYQDLLAETVFKKSLERFIVSSPYQKFCLQLYQWKVISVKARVMWLCKSIDLHSRKHFPFLYYFSSSASPKSISIGKGRGCMLFVLHYVMDSCS